jgi:two-component system, cell cycle sensor histidine kinase and response regulator CckA
VLPQVIDLNDTVEGMLKMLRRLIGEEIDLAWLAGKDLWPVKMDPGQIDQLMVNLCINARDAIPGVGKITIETANTAFDGDYCSSHLESAPGDYVLLVVSDNGCGMDDETRSRVFDPFFTTKGVGKGTGLGLATVYGIVKQNNGFIQVASEPDRGTTFKICFPRHTGEAWPAARESKGAIPAGRHETILLVEDEPAMLAMTSSMLEKHGYNVLAAATPREAVSLAQRQAGRIHLLLTDVVMPEMNGKDLARTLLLMNPDLKCLFMSGYTANVIAHHNILDSNVSFLQKPFSLDELAAKLREVLDDRGREGR